MTDLKTQLAELCKLEDGWDGYPSSSAMSNRAIDQMTMLIDNIALVPMSDGGIQFEFHILGVDFELTISGEGSVTVRVEK